MSGEPSSDSPTRAEQQEQASSNRAMFDVVAPHYDLLNRLMSLGMDARWRRTLVELSEVTPGCRALDLCCGTGAVTRELSERGAQTVGLDASAQMLAVAQHQKGPIAYVQGDALNTPFPDCTFDIVTIAFGNRNVASLPALFQEMWRIAKPGGRVASLEITGPTSPWLRRLFFLYFAYLPPLMARLLGADLRAYNYLPDSVRRYPEPNAIASLMCDAGLRDVAIHQLLAGAVVIHRGIR